jgi:tRNA uridine 5-carbamoylmethylation protein Kti12
MQVINVFGGPGSGKSTTAAGLFFEMKKRGHNVEYVTEYAKDMTWEERSNILEDQLYILAKQNRRLSRLAKHNVEYVITDSPLILGIVYALPTYFETFPVMVLEVFHSYDNINFFIHRNTDNYSKIGRNQTLEEAMKVDCKMQQVLADADIHYQSVFTTTAVEEILKQLEL